MIAAGVWLFWTQIAPRGTNNIFDLVGWWAKRAAVYQSYLSQAASGWLQREFNKLPTFMHIPVLILYGALRPFLPATLVAYRVPAMVWDFCMAFAGLGGHAAFPLSTRRFRSFWIKKEKSRNLSILVCVVIWAGILIASMRGGGDDWDNPRYRLLFLTLQAGLAGWVWTRSAWRNSVGLRRALIGSSLFFLWFMPWYIRRYHGMPWGVVSIFHTIGLALASVVLYILWDWARIEEQGKGGMI